MSRERQGEWHEWPFEPLEILQAFAKYEVNYVLVGALAAILQGSPLPAYTVDITLAPGQDNYNNLLGALKELEAVDLSETSDDVRPADQTSLTFYTSAGHVDIDCPLPGFKTYNEVRRESNLIELDNLSVSTLSLRGIVRSKAAIGDQSQLAALEATMELYRGLTTSSKPEI